MENTVKKHRVFTIFFLWEREGNLCIFKSIIQLSFWISWKPHGIMATSIAPEDFCLKCKNPTYHIKIFFILSKYNIIKFQNYISVLAQLLQCLLRESCSLLFCRGIKSPVSDAPDIPFQLCWTRRVNCYKTFHSSMTIFMNVI